MGAARLLADLNAAGFTLTADGERLLVAPADRLTDELRAAIRRYKPVLLAVAQALTPGQRLPGVVPDLAGDDYHEAEALILGALGFPRSSRLHAELIRDPARHQAVMTCLDVFRPLAGQGVSHAAS